MYRVLNGTAADTFSVDQIRGKTLIANKPVNVYSYPADSSTPIGTISIGQPVGVVYSWLDADPSKDRAELWWVFDNGTDGFYYTKHEVGLYNISSLVQQGVMTDLQLKEDAQTPAWLKALKDTALQYAPWIIGGIVIIAIGKKLIDKKL